MIKMMLALKSLQSPEKTCSVCGLPLLTMRVTSVACVMDNFLAPHYISLEHLTFIDTAHFNIPSNEGLHKFNTRLVWVKASIEHKF